jgi:hypothetical protein
MGFTWYVNTSRMRIGHLSPQIFVSHGGIGPEEKFAPSFVTWISNNHICCCAILVAERGDGDPEYSQRTEAVPLSRGCLRPVSMPSTVDMCEIHSSLYVRPDHGRAGAPLSGCTVFANQDRRSWTFRSH